MDRALRFLWIAVLAAGLPAAAQIYLKSRTLYRPADLGSPRLLRRTAARSHWLVQLTGSRDRSTAAEWRRHGVRVAGFIPPSAAVIVVPDGADPSLLPAVRWSGRLSAEDKVSALV